MSIIKRIFGINPDERTDVPNGLRGTGVAGGTGIYDEYFNQMLFEVQADHIVDTEANVKLADDPRGTCYYDSTSTSFLDRNDATVTFSDGDRIVWKGLDTLTASIDISIIDDLEHIMWQGVTIALGSYNLSLGENQRGELDLSGTGTLSILSSDGLRISNSGLTIDDQSGDIVIDNIPNSPAVDFEAKNLIINVQSNTTVDADADRLSLLNSSWQQKYIDNLNTTFDITTDLMSGTSEYSSTWYQMWIDSEGTRLLVPDFESTTTGTTASKLVDSGATFQTDLIQIGDIVYNLTDLTQTIVTAIDSETQLSVAGDIFTSGEDYKIRILSPTGLGEYKARIGAAYNNSSSNFINSAYIKMGPLKRYSVGAGHFNVTGTNWTTGSAEIVPYQAGNGDDGQAPSWRIAGNITGSLSVAATEVALTISGVTFLSTLQAVSGTTSGADNIRRQRVESGSGIILSMTNNQTSFTVSFDIQILYKPSWAM